VTHCELADALRTIIRTVEAKRKENGWGPSRQVSVSLKASQLLPNFQDFSASEQLQTFSVEKKFYSGHQFSIFANEKTPEVEESKMSWKDEFVFLDFLTFLVDIFDLSRIRCRYYIANDKLSDIGLRLIVAGNAESGIICWIDNYGFYEGGDLNIYRLDPCLLYATLSGRLTERARAILIQRVESKLYFLETSGKSLFLETEIMELRAQLLAISSHAL
jgi:hypothetical protein